MDCEEAKGLYELARDGNSESELERKVAEHLKSCQACAAELRELSELEQQVKQALPTSAAPEFVHRLAQYVHANARGVSMRRYWLWGALAGVAALLMLSVLRFPAVAPSTPDPMAPPNDFIVVPTAPSLPMATVKPRLKLFEQTEAASRVYIDPIEYLEDYGVDTSLPGLFRFYLDTAAGKVPKFEISSYACLDAVCYSAGDAAPPLWIAFFEVQHNRDDREHILRFMQKTPDTLLLPYLRAQAADCDANLLRSIAHTLAAQQVKDAQAVQLLRTRLKDLDDMKPGSPSFYAAVNWLEDLFSLGDDKAPDDLARLFAAQPSPRLLESFARLASAEKARAAAATLSPGIEVLCKAVLARKDASLDDLDLLQALCRLDDTRTSALAQHLMTTNSNDQRRRAAKMLGIAGRDKYLAILKDAARRWSAEAPPDWASYQPALFWALARCGDPEAPASLRRLLQTAQDYVSYDWCIDALLDLEKVDAASLQAVPAMLKDNDAHPLHRLGDVLAALFRTDPDAAARIETKEKSLPKCRLKDALSLVCSLGFSHAVKGYLDRLVFEGGNVLDAAAKLARGDLPALSSCRDSYTLRHLLPLVPLLKMSAAQRSQLVEPFLRFESTDPELAEYDRGVRLAACQAAAAGCPDEALAALLKRFPDERDPRVRTALIHAMAAATKAGGAKVIAALMLNFDLNGKIREAVCSVLPECADESQAKRDAATRKLLRIREAAYWEIELNGHCRDDDPEIAARCQSVIKQTRASTVVAAVQAIGVWQDPAARELLNRALEYPDAEVKRAAAVWLAIRNEDPGLKVLLALASGKDDFQTALATHELLAGGRTEAIPELLQLLLAEDRLRRSWGVGWLFKHTGQELTYDLRLAPRASADAIARWKGWWAQNKESFKLPILPRPLPHQSPAGQRMFEQKESD